MEIIVWKFMNEKDIPDKFMNQECLNMLMLIQFPSIAK